MVWLLNILLFKYGVVSWGTEHTCVLNDISQSIHAKVVLRLIDIYKLAKLHVDINNYHSSAILVQGEGV